MRNPVSKMFLIVAAFMTLLVGDVSAGTAEAAGRRPSIQSVAHGPQAPVRATRRYRARRVSRAAVAPRPAAPPSHDAFARLRQCESGGRYDINTGNGYYGAYQFLPSTWRGVGYLGMPHQAPPEIQDEAARKLQARSGWGQWPACTRRLGLR